MLCHFFKTLRSNSLVRPLCRASLVFGLFEIGVHLDCIVNRHRCACTSMPAFGWSYADNAIIVIPRCRFRALCIIGRKLAVDDVRPLFSRWRVNQIFDRPVWKLLENAPKMFRLRKDQFCIFVMKYLRIQMAKERYTKTLNVKFCCFDKSSENFFL